MIDRRLDLRLLSVFDALMTEKSATYAARRLGITQPTVSTSLNQLRSIFNDELFTRTPTGLQPTERARELKVPVQQALAKVNAVFDMRGFDAEHDERTFNFAMSEHGILLTLPKLATYLERYAPNIHIRVVPKYNPLVGTLLNNDEIDFAIGFIPNAPEHLKQRTLFRDRYVGVMHPSHPLNRTGLTIEEFISARLVLVTATGAVRELLEKHVSKGEWSRRTAVTVDNIVSAASLVSNSHYVSIMFRKLIQSLMTDRNVALKMYDLPLPELTIDMFWHPRYSKSPSHIWMREVIAKITQGF